MFLAPNYCPNCGENQLDTGSKDPTVVDNETGIGVIIKSEGDIPEYNDETITLEFDIYCRVCHWSGMVSPDYSTKEEFNTFVSATYRDERDLPNSDSK